MQRHRDSRPTTAHWKPGWTTAGQAATADPLVWAEVECARAGSRGRCAARPGRWPAGSSTVSVGQRQSTATARAAQISVIRLSLRRPIRSVSAPTETLSMESRLTAVRRRTGSSPGSRMTSLARPRIVVVHGAITARRSRGIAASRDRTTTGRRPISGGSHHQSSPRKGRVLM